MTVSSDIAPLYQKIKVLISSRIFSGELAPNSRVPSENELVRELGVSRMTVNRAVKELESEGLLTRVPGVGTFVAQTQTSGHLLEVRNIADEVRERGHTYAMEVLEHTKIEPPKEVAMWMNIAARAKVFHTVVVHKEDDTPVQFEDRYVNLVSAPVYAKINLKETTPSQFLLENIPLQQVEHTVRSLMPTRKLVQALQMKKNVPCLVLDRKTWSRDVPVSFVHLYHSGETYALSDKFSPQKQ